MNVHTNKPLVRAIIVAVGCLIGAMFASMFIGSPLTHVYSFGDAVRDWIILAVGATLGGLLFSWAGKR